MDQHTTNNSHHNVKFLVFAASLRKNSLNKRLAELTCKTIEGRGGDVEFADMREFDCPSYDYDKERNHGIPQGATTFQEKVLENDALIIVSPEYNGSLPGFLKNAIDWVSRFRPQPFNERQALLMSASPSMAGGNRGLWSLRIPLEHLGARVFPDMFSLAVAHQALTKDGNIEDPVLAQRFEGNVGAFMDLVEAQKHYPCIKKSWVEFLGEKPDPLVERVE